MKEKIWTEVRRECKTACWIWAKINGLGHELSGRRPAAVLEGPHLADGALLRLQPGDAAAHGSPGAAGLLLQAAVRAPHGGGCGGGWHRRHVPGGRYGGVAI